MNIEARARRATAPPRGRVATHLLRAAAVAIMLAAAAVAWVAWRNVAGEPPVQPRASGPRPAADAATLARGGYLARAGNCIGCHTARGGAPLAGGRAIATPFGTVYASNLTPDDDTGLGRWSASEFRRALKHGRSRDGRLLAPAFPYTNFTRLNDDDADAIFAWLMTHRAVRQVNRPHELRFPYRLQAALAVWRALFFRPTAFAPDASRSAAWNRGSYLVNGAAHCLACHAARNFLGGAADNASAGEQVVSAQRWLAPSLADAREAAVGDWPLEDVVALLKSGTSPRGTALGPMAEVVSTSTQHLGDDDLRAIAEYLRTLQVAAPSAAGAASPSASAAASASAGAAAELTPAQQRDAEAMARGERVYEDHCAGCHGRRGEGTPGIAALAGSRAVRLARPLNVVQVIRQGGFLATTAGNPRPFGMPPFAHLLGDDDIAAVATYVRGAWGNDAGAVQPLDVWRAR